jgi:hypothetical protein
LISWVASFDPIYLARIAVLVGPGASKAEPAMDATILVEQALLFCNIHPKTA